jgi:hypothetical protein
MTVAQMKRGRRGPFRKFRTSEFKQFDRQSAPSAEIDAYQRDEPLGFRRAYQGAANQLERLPLFDFRKNEPARAIILKCE